MPEGKHGWSHCLKGRIQSTDRSVLSKISGVSGVSAIVSWLAEHMRNISPPQAHNNSVRLKQLVTNLATEYATNLDSETWECLLSIYPGQDGHMEKKHLFVFQKKKHRSSKEMLIQGGALCFEWSKYFHDTSTWYIPVQLDIDVIFTKWSHPSHPPSHHLCFYGWLVMLTILKHITLW